MPALPRVLPKALAPALLALATCGLLQLSCAPRVEGEPGGWSLRQVVDGDTIRVAAAGETRLVRLVGIDAPERHHPERLPEFLADEARERLAQLLSEGPLELVLNVRGDAEDRYGRMLRYLQVPGAGDPAETLLREGLVRVYDRFPHDRLERYRALEREARAAGRGVWADEGLAELRWRLSGRGPDIRVVPVGGADFAVVYGDQAVTGLGGERLLDALWAARRAAAARARGDEVDAARLLEKAGFRPLQGANPRR